MEEIGGFVLS